MISLAHELFMSYYTLTLKQNKNKKNCLHKTAQNSIRKILNRPVILNSLSKQHTTSPRGIHPASPTHSHMEPQLEEVSSHGGHSTRVLAGQTKVLVHHGPARRLLSQEQTRIVQLTLCNTRRKRKIVTLCEGLA